MDNPGEPIQSPGAPNIRLKRTRKKLSRAQMLSEKFHRQHLNCIHDMKDGIINKYEIRNKSKTTPNVACVW